MKKSIVRIGVAVFAVTVAAFLLSGCEDGASKNNDGLVDGFLVRVNEKPGTGSGTGTYTYKLTVSSIGSGATASGNYYVVGQTVFINAGTEPESWVWFKKWTTASKGVTFDDAEKASTSFTMPANDVTITALFDTTAYTLTVLRTDGGTGATGSGPHKVGESVRINAGAAPNGWSFAGWWPDGEDVIIADGAITTFMMVERDIEIWAAFKGQPTPSKSKFTDSRDSHTYDKVTIGGVTWMAENLNYETESDSYCYENSADSCAKYGRLYTWSAAKTACPTGWHLPTRDEWGTLAKYAGGAGTYGSGGTAGKKLKSISGWNINDNGTDDFGFSSLPSGLRFPNGKFDNVGSSGGWWTATDTEAYSNAYERYVNNGNSVYENHYTKTFGFSVRCVSNN